MLNAAIGLRGGGLSVPSRGAVARFVGLVVAALLIPGPAARAQCGPQWLPGDGVPGLNGRATASTLWDPDGPGPAPPRLVVGGYFTIAGNLPAKSIAAYDLVTGQWSALGSGTGTGVFALSTISTGDLVAGGQFSTAGGGAAKFIARWNGTAWSALGSGMGSDVYALLKMPNGDLVAGGYFTSIGGMTANRIARWDGASWSALGSGMGGNASGFVSALTILPNGDLVAGGLFSTAGGVPANCIARWNGSAWSALGSGMTGKVSSLLYVDALTMVPNGDLVAGGAFTTAGTVTANCIARWDGTTWSAFGTGMSGSTEPYVHALTMLPDGDLIAVGGFTTAGSHPSVHFARWTENPLPRIAVDPLSHAACSTAPVTLSATPANGYSGVSYQWRRNGVDITDGPGGASPGGGTVSGASGVLPSPTDGTPATLTITGPRASDSGDYTVVFTNPCGSVTSNPAALAVCPADFNCDGFLDPTDYTQFINAFEAGSPSADYNGDGFVDPLDYNQFINDYESGC